MGATPKHGVSKIHLLGLLGGNLFPELSSGLDDVQAFSPKEQMVPSD